MNTIFHQVTTALLGYAGKSFIVVCGVEAVHGGLLVSAADDASSAAMTHAGCANGVFLVEAAPFFGKHALAVLKRDAVAIVWKGAAGANQRKRVAALFWQLALFDRLVERTTSASINLESGERANSGQRGAHERSRRAP